MEPIVPCPMCHRQACPTYTPDLCEHHVCEACGHVFFTDADYDAHDLLPDGERVGSEEQSW